MNIGIFITRGNAALIRQHLMVQTPRMTPREYGIVERVADAVINNLLNQFPVYHPDSVQWDNRRKPK